MRAVSSSWLCAVVVGLLAGCRPPDATVTTPAVIDAGVADAGVAAVVVDAGVTTAAAPVDAGQGGDAVPVVETLVDAGTMADPPAPPPPPPTPASADPSHPVGHAVFDRLLVKPKTASERPDAVQKQVERLLGQKVKSVRRTAGTFWLVQLQPTTPPRTKVDQARAVEKLQKSGAFQSVEGDQLMTIKSGLKLPTLR